MSDRDKTIDQLPDSFESEEEAGAFWDVHSTMDYQEHLEPSNDTIEIRERVFDVIAENGFKKLLHQAESQEENES